MAANTQKDKLIEIRELHVTYFPDRGKPVYALNGVNLDISPGQIIGILGESGCGKSTLSTAILRLLSDHRKLEQGQIIFRGQDLLKLPETELNEIRGREIAMITQDPALALNPVITAGDQIAEVLRAHT